jgi:hypothetical protein
MGGVVGGVGGPVTDDAEDKEVASSVASLTCLRSTTHWLLPRRQRETFPFPPRHRLKEEEGAGGVVWHHGPVCLIGVDARRRRGGGVRGVVFAAVIEPSGR